MSVGAEPCAKCWGHNKDTCSGAEDTCKKPEMMGRVPSVSSLGRHLPLQITCYTKGSSLSLQSAPTSQQLSNLGGNRE